jgi:hypothetical protein
MKGFLLRYVSFYVRQGGFANLIRFDLNWITYPVVDSRFAVSQIFNKISTGWKIG